MEHTSETFQRFGKSFQDLTNETVKTFYKDAITAGFNI